MNIIRENWPLDILGFKVTLLGFNLNLSSSKLLSILNIFSSLIWISHPKSNVYFLSLKDLFRSLYPRVPSIDVGLNLRVGQKQVKIVCRRENSFGHK